MSDENFVTLRIPAALYYVLVREVEFASACASYGAMGHSREDAQTLYELLLKQGGANIVQESK